MLTPNRIRSYENFIIIVVVIILERVPLFFQAVCSDNIGL